MDQITRIEAIVNDILAPHDLQLYEVKWANEGNMRILRIAIMRKDKTMDIDTCAMISELISTQLDEEDFIGGEYYLEVCSPGAERELRSREDILEAKGEYIYAKFKNVISGGLFEVYGTLLDIKEDTLEIEYMQKAVKKKLLLDMDNISLIRLSVRV